MQADAGRCRTGRFVVLASTNGEGKPYGILVYDDKIKRTTRQAQD